AVRLRRLPRVHRRRVRRLSPPGRRACQPRANSGRESSGTRPGGIECASHPGASATRGLYVPCDPSSSRHETCTMTRSLPLQVDGLDSRDVPALVAYGLVGGNQLFQFNPNNPMSIARVVVLTGIANGNTLVGIDFAPNGTLYGVATANAPANTFQLYTLNKTSGVATAVGGPQTVPNGGTVLGTTAYGVDVNPVSGVIQ